MLYHTIIKFFIKFPGEKIYQLAEKKKKKNKKEKKTTQTNEITKRFELTSWIKQKQPPEVFHKKGILKILQNLQENTRVRVSFLIKLRA